MGIGDIVEAVVLKIDKESQKISLGFKQLEPDPWANVASEFPYGSVIKGKVRNIAAFGAFIELKEGVDGLVHISDMSWTKKINHPGELLKKNDTIDVKVLDIDVEKRRISLGIKQLTDDPWTGLSKQFAVGVETECEVARILDRGMIVNLTDSVEGFIPLNQLGQDVDHPSEIHKVGEKIFAEVVEFDLEGRKIILSISDYFKDKDENVFKQYLEAHVPQKIVKEEKQEKLEPVATEPENG